MELQGKWFLLVAVFAVISSQITVKASIIVNVNLLSYDHDCREDPAPFDSSCDPMFRFCLTRPVKKPKFSSKYCKYGFVKRSSHFQDYSFINFQTVKSKRGIPIPWIMNIKELYDNNIMLAVQVYDHDSGFLFSDHDHMVTMSKNMTYTIHQNKENATEEFYYVKKSEHTLKYEITIHCDTNFQGSQCQDCVEGWTGPNCLDDVDECQLGYCERGECQNVLGDYHCKCPVFYAGKNCERNINPCNTVECKNDGVCLVNAGSSTSLSHVCHCREGWTGELCENRNDPCLSHLCLNGGKCISSSDKINFTCKCTDSFVGQFCDKTATTAPTTTVTTTTPTTTMTTPTTTSTTPETSTSTTSTSTVPSTLTTASTTTTTTLITDSSTTVTSTTAGLGGGDVGKSKSEAHQSTFEPYHGIIIFVALALIIVCTLAFVFVKRRKDKKLMYANQGLPPPSGAVIMYNQHEGHLAFENNMYTEANRNNMAVERGQTIPPVPSRPPSESDDVFYPIKPVRPSEYEVPTRGATGGTYDNNVGKAKQSDKDLTSVKGVSRLSAAPAERAENNPYQDFKSLHFKKEQKEGKIEIPVDEDDLCFDDDEDQYQELDELAMTADKTPIVTVNSHDSVVPMVPPPRIQMPQELPPVITSNQSVSAHFEQDSQGLSNPAYEDGDEENDDGNQTYPYTEVNKSRHSTDTLPLRHSMTNERMSSISEGSGYDVPSGIGPRYALVNGDSVIYHSPRPDSSSEYNVPNSLPANPDVTMPNGLMVTSDPWTPDPFLSSETNGDMNETIDGVIDNDDVDIDIDDSSDDDNEPDDIQHLKNEVKEKLDFVLLRDETKGSSNI